MRAIFSKFGIFNPDTLKPKNIVTIDISEP